MSERELWRAPHVARRNAYREPEGKAMNEKDTAALQVSIDVAYRRGVRLSPGRSCPATPGCFCFDMECLAEDACLHAKGKR